MKMETGNITWTYKDIVWKKYDIKSQNGPVLIGGEQMQIA